MNMISRLCRYTIALCVVSLIVLLYLGLDRYSKTYAEWYGMLTDLKLASYRLDKANSEVFSGLRIDYDDLTQHVAEINAIVAGIKSAELRSPGGEQQLYMPESILRGHSQFMTQLQALYPLVTRRHAEVENYKTHYSVLRNSENIALQLIDDLKSTPALEADLLQAIRVLELNLFREFRYSGAAEYESTMQQINRIQNRFADNNAQVADALYFIRLHLDLIASNKPLVESIILAEIAFSSQLQRVLTGLETELKKIALHERARSQRYYYALGILAALMLPLCIWQARLLYLQSSTIARHNDELEALVARRTQRLAEARDKLEEETHEREQLCEQLVESEERLHSLINSINGCVYEYSLEENRLTYASSSIEGIWGTDFEQAASAGAGWNRVHEEDNEKYQQQFAEAMLHKSVLNTEYRAYNSDTEIVWLRDICTPIGEGESVQRVVGVVTDVSEFKRAGEARAKMEDELAHAQKLEAVGQLAAGIAHEINTPSQFIADNLNFLLESVSDIFELVKAIAEISKDYGDNAVAKVNELIDGADFEYLSEEIPVALQQSSEGISRVATIVRAMKDYSHPGETMQLADINAALSSTVTVSSGEWKYYAKMTTDFADELPLVECVISDINQVILNMIVNATHAIVDRFEDAEETSGLINIRTKQRDNTVLIEVQDNGKGMPPEVKARVFEQFFTTKGVGKGTGQGLSIAHRLVVDKHNGAIEIDSTPGEGTVFRIVLPVEQPRSEQQESPDSESRAA